MRVAAEIATSVAMTHSPGTPSSVASRNSAPSGIGRVQRLSIVRARTKSLRLARRGLTLVRMIASATCICQLAISRTLLGRGSNARRALLSRRTLVHNSDGSDELLLSNLNRAFGGERVVISRGHAHYHGALLSLILCLCFA